MRQVPGTATDSLSSNTQLGRAVQSACSELELLSSLVRSSCFGLSADCTGKSGVVSSTASFCLPQERDAQEKAQALLWKLGYKGDLHRPSTPEVAEACRSDT